MWDFNPNMRSGRIKLETRYILFCGVENVASAIKAENILDDDYAMYLQDHELTKDGYLYFLKGLQDNYVNEKLEYYKKCVPSIYKILTSVMNKNNDLKEDEKGNVDK